MIWLYWPIVLEQASVAEGKVRLQLLKYNLEMIANHLMMI